MDAANLLSILFPIAVIQFVGWAVPGPNHLTIITASVTAGRPAGLKAAIGIAAGAFTWTLIAISGIAVLFELVPSLYIALRLFGAGYLIYLGINAFRAVRQGGMFSLDASAKSPATYAPFRTAYFVMITNPKAVLFFGSILTAFIPPDSSALLMIIRGSSRTTWYSIERVCGDLFFFGSFHAIVSGSGHLDVDFVRRFVWRFRDACRLGRR